MLTNARAPGYGLPTSKSFEGLELREWQRDARLLFKGLKCERAWLQGSIFGFILFHWQHYANVPNMYFGIPKDEHERDLASLMGDSHITHAQ